MGEETKIVAQIEKNSREQVWIGLNQWKDQWYLFLRTYVPSLEEPDTWIPTKKGVSLAISAYPLLREAIQTLGQDLLTEHEAAVIGKSKTQEVRLGINQYKGMALMSIRTFMEIEGEKRPTQKGISLKTEFYPQLKEGIQALGETIQGL